MAGTKTIIQDQDGARWLILKGDPAWNLVVELRKARTVLVLPRETITHCIVPLPQTIEVQMRRLGTAAQITDDPAIVEAYKRSVTLYDCLAQLARGMI